MNLSIEIIEERNKSKVMLAGEIDLYTAPQLKAAVLPITKTAGKIVEVDLQHVDYMDSTGLGVFISALKSTKENHSKLKLVHLQERVLRLFSITGLDEIMDMDTGTRGGDK